MTWRVELQTSGGITGRGNGSLTVSSDGNGEATSSGGRRQSGRLSDSEIETIEASLRARDASWKVGEDSGGADYFTYVLTVQEGDASAVEYRWNDGSGSRVPPSMRKLIDELWQIHRRLLQSATS